MLILLSPAKTLDFSAAPPGLPATRPRFEKDVAVLLERCKKLGPAELRKLMKISPALAELNHRRFQEMRLPFTRKNSKAALLAFKGDVYRGLDAASLSEEDLDWAQDHLRILSGLYGLLRPLDLIQPYRLEMGTKLANPRGKTLYAFWGDRLARALNAEHAKRPVPAVLNLASNEYAKAVPPERLEMPLVSPAFQWERDGKLRTIALHAKKARGLMARFVVRNRVEDPEGLRAFTDEGYKYNPRLSTPDRPLFARKRRAA